MWIFYLKGYDALIHLLLEADIKTHVKLHTAIPNGGLYMKQNKIWPLMSSNHAQHNITTAI